MIRTLKPNGIYFAYLRKSRADRDAEAHGEGETLARHEKILNDLANKLNIHISRFYREIVSAENIQDRPVVNELLQDINTGDCDGVLVVEVERLARGDTSDQGTIAKYFKFSDTIIITPSKTYDPTDEFDEEYFEFGLFMSRREYKTINRRIQRGRISSVQEGKWIASTAPYGYERIKIENAKGYTLQIIPEQAEIIKLVYDLYLHGEQQPDGTFLRLGHYLICKKLDSLGIKPVNSSRWSPSTIKDILNNFAYIGKVCWGKEVDRKIICDGKVKKIRERNPDFKIYNGLHPAIIDDTVFHQVQELKAAKPIAPVVSNQILKNPLSGVVRCSKCGSWMTRTYSNTKAAYFCLSCPNRQCQNVSAPLSLVEEMVLNSLNEWLKGYSLKYEAEKNNRRISDEIRIKENAILNYDIELKTLNKQKDNTYDFLEQGIYSPEIFQQRLSAITGKISLIKDEIQKLQKSLTNATKTDSNINSFIPSVQRVLDAYNETDDISVKNKMLKSLLCYVDYSKDSPNKKFQRYNANFQLNIYPRIPESQNLR